MKTLSVILLVAALAQPAAAQVYGAPRDPGANSPWIAAFAGSFYGVVISDRASDGTWRLEPSKPVGAALDWGTSDRSIGIRVVRDVPRMDFTGGQSYNPCRGQVQALAMLGTYRRATPLYNSGLLQVVELAAGVTTWSGLKGLDGHVLPSVPSNTDFTYAIAFGIALPLGDRLEGMALYDLTTVRHERERIGAADKASSSFEKLSGLRFGARLRFGK